MTTLVALDQRIAELGALLTATTAGAPLCRTHMGPAVKEHEGRIAALMAARRAIRRDGQEAAVVILQQWEQDAATGRARGGASWEAYWAGGIAELHSLTSRTTSQITGPAPARKETP